MVSARGASITAADGTSIQADQILIVDSENNSQAFGSAMSLGQTITRWTQGASILKSGFSAASQAYKANQLTARLRTKSQAGTDQARIAAEAAAAQPPAEALPAAVVPAP